MRKAIINISNRIHEEWSDAEQEAFEAYRRDDVHENTIVDFIPYKTDPSADTATIWGIVNQTLDLVNDVFNSGTPIAAVIADLSDPVTNHRFVKSCAFPCVIPTHDDNGDFVTIREY